MKIGSCEYPDHLLYDVEAGTWARSEGGEFRVGIAPHLSWISGGFASVSFKAVGSHVGEGKSLGSVEGPRHFDIVRAPFQSMIKAVNVRLSSEPILANRDPFGEGWFALLLKVGAPSRLQTLAEAYDSIANSVKRLGVHCFAEFPDHELFEIGVECSAVLVKLNDGMATWESGTVVHIVSDDSTADVEMTRWERQTGNMVVESRVEGDLHHFIVKKT